MKKALVRKWLPVLFLGTLWSCGPQAVIISDAAFSLGFDRSGEASLVREFPDLERLLARQGYKTLLFSIDSAGPQWEDSLARSTADLFVWAPLRGAEAVQFHQDFPETRGLWLSLGEGRITAAAPGNLSILIPRRENGWDQLESKLLKEGYRRIAGVFLAGAETNQGTGSLISDIMEWSYYLNPSEDPARSLDLLKNQVAGEADFIILAAGEANYQLYQELRHWQIPLFMEAPFPGAESDFSVKGLFVTDWEEGLKTVRAGYGEVPAGLQYFDSHLWWRTTDTLQPLE